MPELTKNEIVKKIKQKRELSGITNSVILSCLNKYLSKYKIDIAKLRKAQIKIVVREVRAELRRLTGQYSKSLKSKTSTDDILASHTSTSERLLFYLKLKKIIKQLKINSLLDLGCGLNPLALARKDIKYFASDINENNLNIVRKHFNRNSISGRVFVYDLTKISHNLPKADLCLIFKTLDIIGKNYAEKILSLVPCHKILVSFATKKLSGMPMRKPRRIWFEKILERNNWKYKTFASNNEMFYLIEKQDY